MKVTIKDIAKMAGVSHPTVSKALNNEPGVSQETREKIMSIAQSLNYIPNLAAKRLADRKTNSIGLIWPQSSELFFYHLFRGIQREAANNGVNVLMSMAEQDIALRTFNEHFVDMVIAWLKPGWVPSTAFLKEKELFNGKMLVMGGGFLENTHRITIDRKTGIYMAVKYLKELNHSRIAYIGDQNDKLIGYMQGMLEFKLEYNPEHVMVYDNGLEIPEEKFTKLLTMSPKPTAVVVDSHGFAFQLLKVLRKFNINIPGDFSLVIYDNLPEMETFDVPITTIGPSIEALAKNALNVFCEDVTERSSEDCIEIEIKPELTIRKSTRKL